MELIVRAVDVGSGNTKFVTGVVGNEIRCASFPSVAYPSSGETHHWPASERRKTVCIPVGPLFYEVGPDVYEKLTGFTTKRPRQVDLRSLLAEQAKELGIGQWTATGDCTRCDNDRFFSHRAGDAGRQIAVIVANDAQS